MHLIQALNFVGHVAMRGGVILFTTHNKRHYDAATYCAERCGEYAVVGDPLHVIPTDPGKILPDVVVMFTNKSTEIDTLNRWVTWSAEFCIPTIALCDSDTDPTPISFPIPGSDDHDYPVELLSHWFSTVINEGKQTRKTVDQLFESHYSKGI